MQINKIQEKLFLSDWKASSRLDILKELEITKVISLGNENEQKFYIFYEGIEYLKIIIDDSPEENISQYFEETNKFISEGNVLVHCNKGISRSATIVIAFLMKKMSYDKAFNLVKRKRHFIKPNAGFIKQLKSLSN